MRAPICSQRDNMYRRTTSERRTAHNYKTKSLHYSTHLSRRTSLVRRQNSKHIDLTMIQVMITDVIHHTVRTHGWLWNIATQMTSSLSVEHPNQSVIVDTWLITADTLYCRRCVTTTVRRFQPILIPRLCRRSSSSLKRSYCVMNPSRRIQGSLLFKPLAPSPTFCSLKNRYTYISQHKI